MGQRKIMIDMVFDLEGGSLPKDYAFFLQQEIFTFLPWFQKIGHAGILPLKGPINGEEFLLTRRTKLVLRIPEESAPMALDLSGKKLNIAGNPLAIGKGGSKNLSPYPTLHAHFVAGASEEKVFLQEVARQLKKMKISCQWICGKSQRLMKKKTKISGFSLVLHDLNPKDSLRMQEMGLGPHRSLGCGIFVPHKTILH